MHSRWKGILSRSAMIGFAAAAVLIATGGTPAMAAHHDDYKGWFISLDAAMTQPNSLDQQYANVIGTDKFETRQVMDNKADFTWALRAGYSWGELGGLAISYWSFDNEDTKNATQSDGFVYPTVFGAYGYNGGSYNVLTAPVDYVAKAKTKASTIDMDYYRPMHGSEKFTVNWIAGLRSATFEEDRSFDSAADSTGNYISQTHHMKSDAFGIKVGANLVFGLSQHFGLQATMAYSFLQAHTDADASQTAAVPASEDRVTASDDHVMGEIRDYDVRGVWSWNVVDFYVGYGGQTWQGLVADPIEGACCGSNRVERSTRDSIAFNSAHAGVTFRFGGGKR